jgi:hypothetical protein
LQIKSKLLSAVNKNEIEECKINQGKCVRSYIFVKTNVRDTFIKKERIHSTRENIKKHIILFGFRFGIEFARVKGLIFLTCKAQPVL